MEPHQHSFHIGAKSSTDEFRWLRHLQHIHQNDCNANVTNSQKLLVFDQSGDETTLIFYPFFPKASKLQPNEGSKQTPTRGSQPSPASLDVVGEKVSDTPEDSEEIDALLYSNDDEDDVSSTGHSPVTTGGLIEEVAGSDGYIRKRKVETNGELLCPRNDDAPELEDDAESKCVETKRVKRDRIRETIGILQDIIPDGRSVEPVRVLDAAIEYLNCLKNRAEALGPSAYKVW